MKKEMLKKMAKAASVALVSGVMLCGAGLAANTSASAQGDPYLTLKQNESLEKVSTKKAEHVISQKGAKATRKAYTELFSHKATKKHARKGNKRANKAAAHEEKGIRAGKYNSHKLGATKRNKKVTKKASAKRAKVAKKTVRRSHAKKVNKRARKASNKKLARRNAIKRANALRRAKAARRNARRSLRRRAVKPMNRRAYRAHLRAVKNFRQSRYYRNVWSSAEKINKRAVRLDQKRLNKTYAANNSKHLTKYEHRALNRSIKAQQRHISYMNGYVNHDAHMLSLAK